MKHQLMALVIIFVLLLTITGCSAAGTVRALDAAEDKVEAKLDAVEDSLEQAVRQTVAPAAPAATAPAAPEKPAPATPDKAGLITREEAEKIALDHTGFTVDQVQRLRTEFEYDDGMPQYDVEYHEGDWEYEFEINGETGKILSFDKDHKYD